MLRDELKSGAEGSDQLPGKPHPLDVIRLPLAAPALAQFARTRMAARAAHGPHLFAGQLPQRLGHSEDVPFVVELRDGGPGVAVRR